MTSKTRTPRGPYAKGQIRRDQIVDTAILAFERLGYRNCSIAGIARECGLTLPGLLHHFPSKEALLIAALERREAAQKNAFEVDEQDWKAFLRAFVEVVRENVRDRGMSGAFVILSTESLADDHPARDWFRARDRRVRAHFADTLRRGIARGEIDAAINPDLLASEIMATMDGLHRQWLSSYDAPDIVAIFAQYIERLIRCCASPQQRSPGGGER